MKTILVGMALSMLAVAQTARFPASVPTFPTVMNRLQTTLSAGISATDTAIPVVSSAGWSGNMIAVIQDWSSSAEIVFICSVGTNVLNVGYTSCPNTDGRGFDSAHGGSVASSHSAHAAVSALPVAWNWNALGVEVEAIASALLGGTYPGTVDWVYNIARKPFEDVRAFGSLGAGVTNDSSIFQSAITALATIGGTVYVPGSGSIYRLDTTVTIPANVSVFIEPGAHFIGVALPMFQIVGSRGELLANGATFVPDSGSSGSVILAEASVAPAVLKNVKILGASIDGAATTGTVYGVRAVSVRNSEFSGYNIEHTSGDGFRLEDSAVGAGGAYGGSYFNHLSNTHVYQAGGASVMVYSNNPGVINTLTLDTLYLAESGTNAIHLEGAATGSVWLVSLRGVYIDVTGDHGIYAKAVRSLRTDTVEIDNPAKFGVYLDDPTSAFIFDIDLSGVYVYNAGLGRFHAEGGDARWQQGGTRTLKSFGYATEVGMNQDSYYSSCVNCSYVTAHTVNVDAAADGSVYYNEMTPLGEARWWAAVTSYTLTSPTVRAAPTAFNITSHGLSNGDEVVIDGCTAGGWDGLNRSVLSATVSGPDNFTIPVNSLGFTGDWAASDCTITKRKWSLTQIQDFHAWPAPCLGIGKACAEALDVSGDVQATGLAGSGNAFACVTSDGKLYRSATACVP